MAADVSVQSVQAEGSVDAVTPSGAQAQMLVIRPGPEAGLVLALEAEQLTERLVAFETTRVQAHMTASHTQPYAPEGQPPRGPARGTLGEVHDGAVILVVPLSPLTVVRAEVDGPVDLVPVREEVVERMHKVADQGERTPGAVPEDFNFTARDTAKLAAHRGGFQTVTGDFMLYLWGVTYELSGKDGPRELRTGQYVVEEHAGVVTVERYVHSFLTVHDGSLSMQYRGAGTALYADAGLATVDGVVRLREADGILNVGRDAYRLSGDAVLTGGAFEWVAENGGVRLASPVTLAATGDIVRLDAAWAGLPWLGAAGGGLTLIAAVLVLWSRGLSGRPGTELGDGRSLTGRERRAAHWNHLAQAAAGHGNYWRASLYAHRAIRNDPVEAGHYMTRALAAANLGRFEQALEHHKMAHWIYVAGQRDPRAVGRNAFEASCAASNLRRSREALHWLRIAVHHDPELRGEAALEPDLGPISQDPAFACLVAGVVNVQWRAG